MFSFFAHYNIPCIAGEEFLSFSSFEQEFASNVWERGENLMVTSGRPSQIPVLIHQGKDIGAW